MAIYKVKLNRYSPRISRHIPNDLAKQVNTNLLEYVRQSCQQYDKDATIVDGLLHTTVVSHLVIGITCNYRTNLLQREEQQFLSTRID